MAYDAGYVVGKIKASDLNADFAYAATFGAYKTGDESVTSSAVLQDDNHLAVAVVATGIYVVELVGYCQSAANAAGDIAFGFGFPSGAMDLGGLGPHNSLASGSQSDVESFARLAQASVTATLPYGCSTSVTTAFIRALLAVGVTGGTLQLKWAQQASNASATTLKAGSHLVIHRIG